jgi:hypothetical protein
LSRYNDILQALKGLGGEAKFDDIYNGVMENDPINEPSPRMKDVIRSCLRYYSEPRRGKECSFSRDGDVWKLVPNEGRVDAKGKGPIPEVRPLSGGKIRIGVEDLPSFIQQVVEPLKKEGGRLSVVVEVVYQP